MIRGIPKRWRRQRPVERLELDEISAIAEKDWARVWRKLGLNAMANGRVIVAELTIFGKAIQPIFCDIGFTSREDVVYGLTRQLYLTSEEAEGFLRCELTADFVRERVERRLTDSDE